MNWELLADALSHVEEGYDFDGVLTAGVRPPGPYVIVTARFLPERARSEADLTRLGLPAPAAWLYRTRGWYGDGVTAALHKAEVVSRLRLRRFYEDQRWQAEAVRAMCPDCEVILVNPARPGGSSG